MDTDTAWAGLQWLLAKLDPPVDVIAGGEPLTADEWGYDSPRLLTVADVADAAQFLAATPFATLAEHYAAAELIEADVYPGIWSQDWAYPHVTFLVDSGYRGLAKDHPDQVIAPPLKPRKDATPEQVATYEAQRKTQSSQRIPAEHAIALIKWWRPLQRYTGRRDTPSGIIRAVTGLAADRAAAW
jgi:hypothetical protein